MTGRWPGQIEADSQIASSPTHPTPPQHGVPPDGHKPVPPDYRAKGWPGQVRRQTGKRPDYAGRWAGRWAGAPGIKARPGLPKGQVYPADRPKPRPASQGKRADRARRPPDNLPVKLWPKRPRCPIRKCFSLN